VAATREAGQLRRGSAVDHEWIDAAEDEDRCLIFGCTTKLVRCHGEKDSVDSLTGCAESSHVLCVPCLDRWFRSQGMLREERGLPPLARRSCPVCKCELRAAGSSMRSNGMWMGLHKIAHTWPHTATATGEDAEASEAAGATAETTTKAAAKPTKDDGDEAECHEGAEEEDASPAASKIFLSCEPAPGVPGRPTSERPWLACERCGKRCRGAQGLACHRRGPCMASGVPPTTVTPTMNADDAFVISAERVVEPPPSMLEGIQLHMSARSATGYKNVCEMRGQFMITYWHGGRTHHLGNRYATAAEAALAYARYLLQQAEANGEPPLPEEPLPRMVPQVRAAAAAAAFATVAIPAKPSMATNTVASLEAMLSIPARPWSEYAGEATVEQSEGFETSLDGTGSSSTAATCWPAAAVLPPPSPQHHAMTDVSDDESDGWPPLIARNYIYPEDIDDARSSASGSICDEVLLMEPEPLD